MMITVSADLAQRIDDWLFTFGPDHVHPVTGEALRDRYVKIRGSWLHSRQRLISMFGIRWSSQYDSSFELVLETRYGGTELPPDEWPPVNRAWDGLGHEPVMRPRVRWGRR